MDNNIVTGLNCIEETKNILGNNFSLLFYSHIPTAVVALFVGVFVFIKNKKELASKILLSLCFTFSAWLILNLILWISNDSREIVYFWIIVDILDPLFFALSLYFVYVFIDKEDVSLTKKIIVTLLFLPLIFMILTKLGVNEFDVVDCSGVEGKYFLNYIYFMEIAISLWAIIVLIKRYIKSKLDQKKQIIILSSGIIFFLVSFFVASYVSEYIVENGSVYGYRLEFYGNFGITVFLGLLAYLIVKFKAFNIKLIGAQALVVAFVILIGSELFFAENATNKILVLITLALAIGFGYFLIKSIKAEVRRKEELQYMSDALAKANDQLRKLDNAKSDFISIASHQLRTPLTSIKGFISLLLEGSYGKVASVQQEALNKVYQSNERLIHLVEDLLDISRIESGRMEFNFAPCQLADLCQEVVDAFAIRAKGEKLYLEYKKPAKPLPEIMIDAGKVREVISNMVDNALKYTPKGGVNLKVELADSSNYQPPVLNNGQGVNEQDIKIKGAVLRVIVSDTGIGIPVTELPYLFSKFSRGKDIGRLNAGGTGLGLYVGRSMIETNGGKIWAESKGDGQGSQFIIELPVEQSPEILARWS